jgi:hypothetical protein
MYPPKRVLLVIRGQENIADRAALSLLPRSGHPEIGDLSPLVRAL